MIDIERGDRRRIAALALVAIRHLSFMEESVSKECGSSILGALTPLEKAVMIEPGGNGSEGKPSGIKKWCKNKSLKKIGTQRKKKRLPSKN